MKRITTLIAIGIVALLSMGMSTVNQRYCHLFCAEQCFLLATPVDRLPESKGKRPPPRDQENGSVLRRLTDEKRDGRGQFFDQRQLPPNFAEHVMAVAQEIDPALATQLKSMCESDPEGFERVVRRQGRRLGSLVRLRDSDPELFEIKVNEFKADAEIARIVQVIRESGLKDPLFLPRLEELKAHVRLKMALSIRAKTFYIKRMEQHLEAMKSELENSTSNFDQIVDERVDQLIQRAEEGKTQKTTK